MSRRMEFIRVVVVELFPENYRTKREWNFFPVECDLIVHFEDQQQQQLQIVAKGIEECNYYQQTT